MKAPAARDARERCSIAANVSVASNPLANHRGRYPRRGRFRSQLARVVNLRACAPSSCGDGST